MDIKNFDFNKLEVRFLSMLTGSEDTLMAGIYNKSPVVLDWYNNQRKKWVELECAYDFNYDFVFVKVSKARIKNFARVYYNFKYKKYIIEFEAPKQGDSIYDASIEFAKIVDIVLNIYNFTNNSEKYPNIHIPLLTIKFGLDIFHEFAPITFLKKFVREPIRSTLIRFFDNTDFVDRFRDEMSIDDILDFAQYWTYDTYEEEDNNGDSDSMGDQTSE